jgi:ABC-type lipoprotein release transport system permease subunit
MACFLVTLRLGLLDLVSHRRLALIMALSIAISLGMLAILEMYRTGVADKYTELAPGLLLVHESQSLGEFYGSRLSSRVGEELSAMGLSMVVSEIRTLVGSSARNAILLRGLDLEHYTRLESFSILSGRRLLPGDPPRQAMIGWRLARIRALKTGQLISLRGRNFNIVGIFRTDTYMDNQAWISLTDAQALLGWEQDVSFYIIPDEGILQAGELLQGGISVSRKGESLQLISGKFQPMIDMMLLVVSALGIATTLGLTSTLLRLAWLRRREVAILRTTGFPNLSLAGYLLAQATGITLLGVVLAGLFTLVFTTVVQVAVPSLTIIPRLESQTALSSLGWIGLMMVAGSLTPVWWLSHLNLAQLLHSE